MDVGGDLAHMAKGLHNVIGVDLAHREHHRRTLGNAL